MDITTTGSDLASLFGYAAACVSCIAVLVFLLLRRKAQGRGQFFLCLGVALSALWAGLSACYSVLGPDARFFVSLAETMRDAAWISLLVILLAQGWRSTAISPVAYGVTIGLGILFIVQISLDVLVFSQNISPFMNVDAVFLLSRLLVAIGGLFLVHNLYANLTPGDRWSLRSLCLAIGALFVYDLNLYAIAALYGHIGGEWLSARGSVYVLLVPLIALSAQRQADWRLEMRVSRQVVFTTVSLIAVGTYFLAMAAGSYVLRLVGGDLSALLQIIFTTATLIVLVVLLFSGSLRAWVRVKINKHFFAYKYDYRAEWLRFIDTVSGSSDSHEALQQRIVRGICDIVDSPGGSLWINDQEYGFRFHTRYNFRTACPGVEMADSPLIRYFSERGRIVDFSELHNGQGDYGTMTIPEWARPETRSWLGIPLVHSGHLIGFVVLEQPRAARSLNWEDFDLLRTAGQQAASYLAEQASQKIVADNAEFEAFNRRFAFIMHDIKNLVSQLSVLTRNAERHAHNADFRQDMIATLHNSISKMNDLLARLKQHRTGHRATIDLVALVSGVVNEKSRVYPHITFASDVKSRMIAADAGRLEYVFHHLIQNAIDASGSKPITVSLNVLSHASVVVRIQDQGCGMSEDFMRDQLFRPFYSTKENGMGLGVYEARDSVRAHGGRLEVHSVVGKGSAFEVFLPSIAHKDNPLPEDEARALPNNNPQPNAAA